MKPLRVVLNDRLEIIQPLRVDYTYHNPTEALGKAALERGPLAFVPDEQRAGVLNFYCPISWHLPPQLTLAEAAEVLRAL